MGAAISEVGEDRSQIVRGWGKQSGELFLEV